MRDMDEHLTAQGIDTARYAVRPADTATAQRTRYATPGAACGTGYVRPASDAQRRFLRRLMAERDTTSLVRLPGSEDIDRISLKGATDLIERLMACPVKADAPVDAPSEKQIAFALSLAARKGTDATREQFAAMTRREISAAIDALKALADAAKPAATEPAEQVTEGMYRNPTSGMIYKVQRAHHGSGNLYAKRLTVTEFGVATFEYAAGVIRTIRPEWRMSLDEAREFGALYGVCCVCSATLTDEASIARGIGPMCARKM